MNIVEIPVLNAVSRGTWKQVSYQSKRVMVEDEIVESKAVEQKEQQIAESKDEEECFVEESEDEEIIEESIAEMNKIIENQQKSKSSRYCQMIRESMEFSKEEAEEDSEDDDISQGDYESLKSDVLKIIQRKIDAKSYKKQIKECKRTAILAETELPIGTGFKSLMKTYKKVLRSTMKKWIIYKLLCLSRPYK